MKIKSLLASLLLVIFSVFVLASCKNSEYTVSFNVDGGSSIENITTEDGKISKPADPTKAGYKFGGWYKDEALTEPFDFSKDTIDADTTLYAKWDKVTSYTVTFNVNGGTAVAAQTVEENGLLKEPTAPTKTGSTFVGWYKDEALTEAWNFASDKVTSNITLYAKWSDNVSSTTYIVKFDTDGGNTINPQAVNGGDLLIKPNNPTKSGSTFVGWYKDEALTEAWNFATDKVTSNITLYAKWEESGSSYDIKTIAEIMELAKSHVNEPSDEMYYVEATIDEITDKNSGHMNISDGTGSLVVYYSHNADGTQKYGEMSERPVGGDVVLFYSQIQYYKSEKYELVDARIISFESNQEPFDPADYEQMTIAEARTKEAGAKVTVEGVVAAYTYNSALSKIGVVLVDNSGSIYLYDTAVAANTEVGNKIKVAGVRDNWILDNEQASADKYGYDGCIQLADCHMLENDKSTTNDWDKSWIEESTIKEMMSVEPKNNNITTKLYKVNALITRNQNEGENFVNYYVDDINGELGTYVYTQANGKDFSWLDEFDGKICTVYLMVLNYKSTSTGVVPRLLPIEVIDENYQFDLTKTAVMVMEYYVVDQFKVDTYYADPALELVSLVSNELLGFENVEITYKSNDAAITINNVDGKTIMNVDCTTTKDVIVTATVKYDEQTLDKQFTIHIGSLADFKCVTVKEATAVAKDNKVIVRGIVGPSLVNQKGFYLIDETGVIAIRTTDDVLNAVSIGDEVIISGVRAQWSEKNGLPGQTCITDGVLEVNLYGDNDYPTTSFITDKDLAYITSLEATEDHSTEVYVVKATVVVPEGDNNRGTVELTDGTNTIQLYHSSASQYSWLFDYAGQELTYYLAPSNWNAKPSYKGCVLAVQLADGTIINNTLNFN